MKKIVRNSWNIVHVYSLKEFMEAFAQNLDEIPIGKSVDFILFCFERILSIVLVFIVVFIMVFIVAFIKGNWNMLGL